MHSPELDELSGRLIEIGQCILDTPGDDLPAIASLIGQRAALVGRIAAGIETNPAAVTHRLLANLLSAEAAGERMTENLNLVRAGLCDQLQSLYRDNFHLRAWLAEAINQPQECDCRG